MSHHFRRLGLINGSASDGLYGVDKLGGFGREPVEVKSTSRRLHSTLGDVIEHRSELPISKTTHSARQATDSDIVAALPEREDCSASRLANLSVAPHAKRHLAMAPPDLSTERRETWSSCPDHLAQRPADRDELR